MPRPRKPTHLKLLAGTARADRAVSGGVTVDPLAQSPPAPDWLPNAHAVNEWNRLAALLVGTRLLSALDLGTLGHLCALHGKLVQLWAAGETPTGHLIAQYNTLSGSFGLTPVMRAKVPMPSKPREENPFLVFRS